MFVCHLKRNLCIARLSGVKIWGNMSNSIDINLERLFYHVNFSKLMPSEAHRNLATCPGHFDSGRTDQKAIDLSIFFV